MQPPSPEVLDRKLAALRRFLADLGDYAQLDREARRREHYAIERLIQLLCEAAADIGLQFLKARGEALPGSYREVFQSLAHGDGLPTDLADALVAACGMRNVPTHLYDIIDLERAIDAAEPTLAVYGRYADWVRGRLVRRSGQPGNPSTEAGSNNADLQQDPAP